MAFINLSVVSHKTSFFLFTRADIIASKHHFHVIYGEYFMALGTKVTIFRWHKTKELQCKRERSHPTYILYDTQNL